MARTLTDEEEGALQDALELSGAKSVVSLRDFVREHSMEKDLDFGDPKLRDAGMPAPLGKLRDVFILIVNDFTRFAHEQNTYPDMPISLNKKRLTLIVADYTGCSFKTAQTKIDQLVAVGWLENKYGNIPNPVRLWHKAMTEGKAHPGIQR